MKPLHTQNILTIRVSNVMMCTEILSLRTSWGILLSVMFLIICACYVVKFADQFKFSSVPFKGINLCDADPQPCDKTTMICEYKEGTYNCSCKTNFIPTSLSNRLCLGKEV